MRSRNTQRSNVGPRCASSGTRSCAEVPRRRRIPGRRKVVRDGSSTRSVPGRAPEPSSPKGARPRRLPAATGYARASQPGSTRATSSLSRTEVIIQSTPKTRKPRCSAASESPLPDSNRRPLPYHRKSAVQPGPVGALCRGLNDPRPARRDPGGQSECPQDAPTMRTHPDRDSGPPASTLRPQARVLARRIDQLSG
jgi:hypothetical protein